MHAVVRNRIVTSAALLFAFSTVGSAQEWQKTTPAAAGFKADVGEQLDAAFAKGKLRNLHAVLVVRDGKLALEKYYEGPDERWTAPIGNVKFGPTVKHDLRSVSKYVVGLLYGIARSEGKVAAPDAAVLDQFPAYKDLAAEPKRRDIKMKHVLSMTMGLEWREDLPYTDPNNAEVAMYKAKDLYRYVLERPVIEEPGKSFHYSGGATAVLGHLVARGAGVPLFDYANAKLLKPLGITDAEWVGGSNGEVAAASGLRLRPRDLAKIGQLVLQNGRWGEQQIVPAAWLDQATKPQVKMPVDPKEHFMSPDEIELGYGYHWGLAKMKNGDHWIFGPGNGGQRLIVIPEKNLVIVIMAGNYSQPNQDEVPKAVINDILMPALIRK